ncbi:MULTISPECIES: hypothetical protein [unclassified Shewanella]|nr:MULTISPECIES: hypothetical protein [unclassified Shewanella]
MAKFSVYFNDANAQKASHGDLRDDRPPHGRGGRASTDGLAACR